MRRSSLGRAQGLLVPYRGRDATIASFLIYPRPLSIKATRGLSSNQRLKVRGEILQEGGEERNDDDEREKASVGLLTCTATRQPSPSRVARLAKRSIKTSIWQGSFYGNTTFVRCPLAGNLVKCNIYQRIF